MFDLGQEEFRLTAVMGGGEAKNTSCFCKSSPSRVMRHDMNKRMWKMSGEIPIDQFHFP